MQMAYVINRYGMAFIVGSANQSLIVFVASSFWHQRPWHKFELYGHSYDQAFC